MFFHHQQALSYDSLPSPRSAEAEAPGMRGPFPVCCHTLFLSGVNERVPSSKTNSKNWYYNLTMTPNACFTVAAAAPRWNTAKKRPHIT
jgi:hypothetical protein